MTKTSTTGGGVGTNQYAVKGRSRRTARSCQQAQATQDVKAAALADLTHVTLDELDLRGADLSGRDLNGGQFIFCNADHADLRGSDLRNTSLYRTSLRRADLRGADLRGAQFIDCDTDGAQFDGARYSTRTRLSMPDRTLAAAGLVPYRDDHTD